MTRLTRLYGPVRRVPGSIIDAWGRSERGTGSSAVPSAHARCHDATTPARRAPVGIGDPPLTGQGRRGPLNLRLSALELEGLLGDAVATGTWLDAYMFAVGMNQIAEDHLHRDVYVLGEAGQLLAGGGTTARELAGRAASSALSLMQDARATLRSNRDLLAWQQKLAGVVEALARVVCAQSGSDHSSAELSESARRALASLSPSPELLHDHVLRLPSCFQAFDLDVDDVRTLATKFVDDRPDRSRPVVIAGVRTSGSYLAPLLSAILESSGYTDVETLTMRPQHPLLRHERRRLRELGRRDGQLLVIDDPPGSGATIARIARGATRFGLRADSIVLLLPLFGDVDDLPACLRPYPAVLLPESDWAINAKLAPEAVTRAMQRLAGPATTVRAVEPLPLATQSGPRDHRRASYRVDLVTDGAQFSRSVLVEGVGIGYFGKHALAVADELREYVPEVFGLDRGCLYRAWLPDSARAFTRGETPDAELLDAVAEYVHERQHSLRLSADRSLTAVGERPAWEVSSVILSRVFKRAAHPARVLLLDSLTRHLLRVGSPSVVDGATPLSNWFRDDGSARRYVKVDFAKRSFWNLGMLCYDAVFDLAGAGADLPEVADGLRERYSSLEEEPIEDYRWFLYELTQLWGLGRTSPSGNAGVERELARSLQRYMARLFLSDLEPSPDGPLCALDLDGVLESETIGVPGTTLSGAMALRTLIAHGYRPVIVSGRSADDVADRCRSYRLPGGVGEYGSVLVTPGVGAEPLIDEDERRALDRLRADLMRSGDVELDGAYRFSVRAFRRDHRGRRVGLDDQTVDALVATHSRVRPIRGESQTDFVAAGVDKGAGARALAARLGGRPTDEDDTLAFAVGDTVSDLPMLAEAKHAFAPSHARELRRRPGVEVVPVPYQGGLAVAVARFVGHETGACPSCRAPELSSGDALLVSLLSVGERGRLELARRFLRIRRDARAAIAAENLSRRRST